MNTKQDILIFSLYQHLLPFTVVESIVGDVIASEGGKPHVITLFNCTCDLYKTYYQWREGKASKCLSCNNNTTVRKISGKNWNFSTLSDYAKKKDIETVDKACAGINHANMLDFQFKEIEIGKRAILNIVLKYKYDILFTEEDRVVWNEYIDLIKISVLAVIWIERLIEKILPGGLVVFNSNYSVSKALCEKSGKLNVPWYSISGGGSLKYTWDTMILTKESMDNHRLAVCRSWKKYSSKRVLKRNETLQIAEHFDELLIGKNAHAYSAPVNSGNILGLLEKIKDSKTVLLASLSSTDEKRAAEYSGLRPTHPESEYLFATQMKWLDFLIAKVTDEPETALILRIHPRELPNKREGQISKNALLLQEKLVNLPKNIIVNWPADNISFYELLDQVDLVLSCWSTTLLEASLFGCPIVLPQDPMEYYQPIADHLSFDEQDYWSNIQIYAKQSWSIERSIKTFRWYWNSQFACTVSLKGEQARKLSLKENLYIQNDRLRKKLRRGIISESTTLSDAFGGYYRQILNRKMNVKGKKVILETLFGNFDPLQDVQKMQTMQDGRDGVNSEIADPVEERAAVIEQLKRLYKIITNTNEGKSYIRDSKLKQMLNKLHDY